MHSSLTPAQQVIDVRLGGVANASRVLGLAKSTVHGWLREGRIPAHRQPEVFSIAVRAGYGVEPSDFVVYLTDLADQYAREATRDLASGPGKEQVGLVDN